MYNSVQNQKNDADQLILQHASLVKKIAYHLVNRLPPNVQTDDLIQAGMVGLIEAARNYDATQGASFSTYAGIRIRGSMLDEIRRTDWTPRSVHKKARMVAEAIRQIEHEKGRDAQDSEIIALMGISSAEYNAILQDTAGCKIFSVDENFGSEGNSMEAQDHKSIGPYDGTYKIDFRQALVEGISGLPEREKMVITLYYEEEFNLKEIGEILGVSESRVSQIHSQAMIRLRSRMSEWTQ